MTSLHGRSLEISPTFPLISLFIIFPLMSKLMINVNILVKGFYSSAAPLSEEVFKYFQSLDMPIQVNLGVGVGNITKVLNLLLGP